MAIGELQLHEGVVKERRHVVLLSEKKLSERSPGFFSKMNYDIQVQNFHHTC